MDYICGAVDFHKHPDYNKFLNLASLNCFSAYSDDKVMLCRMFDCPDTKSNLFADDKTIIASIGDPFSQNFSYAVFDKEENNLRFYTTTEHQFFYVFSGTELAFATDFSVLEGAIRTKIRLFDNITCLECGKTLTFSRKGLSFN